MEALEKGPVDVRTTRDFEDIAGPIDRLAETLSLPELVALAKLQSGTAAKAISEVEARLRVIYRRVVGAVLKEVMRHPGDKEQWARVNAVAQHVVSDAKKNGHADAYVLNYDAILDSALLGQPGGFHLIDEFSGRAEDGGSFSLPSGAKSLRIQALGWGEAPYWRSPAVYLNHLHGAGSWVQTTSGTVYKARDIDDLRNAGLYSLWAEGADCEVEPVVVLGDQKSRITRRWPFAESYERLRSDAEHADRIVLAGYSFRDEPLNRVLRTSLREKTVIVVIDPDADADARARKAMSLRAGDKRLKLVAKTLPEALGDV